MKKKIAAVVATLVTLLVCICYLQFGREMDVVNSFSFSTDNFMDENIRVTLNQLIITEDAEDIAKMIIQRVLANDFHTIKFNFDGGYPNRLKVAVYKNKKAIESGVMLFYFTYGQVIDDREIGVYDILQAKNMRLEIFDM